MDGSAHESSLYSSEQGAVSGGAPTMPENPRGLTEVIKPKHQYLYF